MSDETTEAVSPIAEKLLEALLGDNAEGAKGLLAFVEEMNQEPSEPKTLADLQHIRDEDGKIEVMEGVTEGENMRVFFYPLTNGDRKRFQLHQPNRVNNMKDEEIVALLSAKYVTPDLSELTVKGMEDLDHVTVMDLLVTLGKLSRKRYRKGPIEGKAEAPS